ncbi:hypothetical protein U14_02731 [Candidatus Moduliflexus flocculans]|uniref:Uncharacterized protein n=1 Tax=Candidatus Moduliflexus flocculans TaxID=1499966 RepID=A0A081BM71_9BACT|nr:hypothetical protein U14_02731 [Candidatus Moduliflexus flocculans]
MTGMQEICLVLHMQKGNAYGVGSRHNARWRRVPFLIWERKAEHRQEILKDGLMRVEANRPHTISQLKERDCANNFEEGLA